MKQVSNINTNILLQQKYLINEKENPESDNYKRFENEMKEKVQNSKTEENIKNQENKITQIKEENIPKKDNEKESQKNNQGSPCEVTKLCPSEISPKKEKKSHKQVRYSPKKIAKEKRNINIKEKLSVEDKANEEMNNVLINYNTIINVGPHINQLNEINSNNINKNIKNKEKEGKKSKLSKPFYYKDFNRMIKEDENFETIKSIYEGVRWNPLDDFNERWGEYENLINIKVKIKAFGYNTK